MIATTMGGSTIGTRKAVRNARIRPELVFSSSANPTPVPSCSTTVQNDSFTCTQRELWNRASVSSSA